MNHITKVAELLDLELDEEFLIKEQNFNVYKFNNNGLMWRGHDECVEDFLPVKESETLQRVLIGNYTIQKIPRKWKPKAGEEYYVPCFGYYSLNSCFGHRIWHDEEYDKWVYSIGIVCKTKEEAIEMAQKMLASIK